MICSIYCRESLQASREGVLAPWPGVYCGRMRTLVEKVLAGERWETAEGWWKTNPFPQPSAQGASEILLDKCLGHAGIGKCRELAISQFLGAWWPISKLRTSRSRVEQYIYMYTHQLSVDNKDENTSVA